VRMEFIDRRPGPLPPGRPAAATSVHTRHTPTPTSAEGQSSGSRITRTSCCAGVPAAVAHRFRSAAEARGFTQYLTAPVSLHEAIRKRADDADAELAAALDQPGLGTVSLSPTQTRALSDDTSSRPPARTSAGLCLVCTASSSYAASAELGPAWRRHRRPGHRRVRREGHSCSSSVADPRSQNAVAKSQTAIPPLVTPCARLSVGLEQHKWPPAWNHWPRTWNF